ncbi:MAG: 50S ribosomal protein L10 [Pseudomonadota bacterium]
MNKEQKAQEVKSLSECLQKAKALIFAGYRGLKVSEMTELRAKLRQKESSLKVVKNRLMKRVLKDQGLGELSKYFTNPTALASSDTDPVGPAKILFEFAKGHGKFEIKGGFLDGAALSPAQIEVLAKLPSREMLLAKALGSMQAPATNLVGALAAIPRKVLYALNAIKATKQ